MEAVISGTFRRILEERRDPFNQLVHRARAGGARIDGAALLRHLAERVGPAVDAVAILDEDRASAVTEALLAVSIETFSRGLLGSLGARPGVEGAWKALAAVPHALSIAPALVAGDVINAALTISRQVPGAADLWCEEIKRVGSRAASPEELRRIGLVLAWKVGLAHARPTALEAWKALDDETARAIFSGKGGVAPPRDVIARDLAHRWRVPAQGDTARLTITSRVGGAALLGGDFESPPSVAIDGDALVASDGHAWWRVHADAFGATLTRCPAPAHPSSGTGAFSVGRSGSVSFSGHRCEDPSLADPTSAAATSDTLAVTTARSFRIRLVGLAGTP